MLDDLNEDVGGLVRGLDELLTSIKKNPEAAIFWGVVSTVVLAAGYIAYVVAAALADAL